MDTYMWADYAHLRITLISRKLLKYEEGTDERERERERELALRNIK
jgi:hypothetical protein